MRYAVISDIHGNYPALKAVLDDAAKEGADRYIFAGDYMISGPYPDRCISEIRNIKDKYMIRGNEERYIADLDGRDQSKWTDGQMQISYYVYRNLSRDNFDLVTGLPLRIDDGNIHIAHSSAEFIGDIEMGSWGPGILAREYPLKSFDEESLRQYVAYKISGDGAFSAAVDKLTDGIYIFGHTHMQWSYRHKDREICLINPGSCGLPLDGIKNSIPYTILDISDDGKVMIRQRRILFDMEKYTEELKKTDQYKEANVWSKVIITELLTAKDHLISFIDRVGSYADSIGDLRRPFAVDTWEEGYNVWRKENGS